MTILGWTPDPLALIFLLVAVLLSLILWRWNRDPENDFELKDLLMENGKASKLACTWAGAFVTMTFAFIHLVLHDKLTDTYAGLYAATWCVPIITKMFAPPKPPEENKP